MKQIIVIVVIAAAVIGLGVILFTQDSKKAPVAQGDILSSNGLHWHPVVSVMIKGQKQEIPANIGTMSSMHTHDSTGSIHVEKSGRVTKEDVKLSTLFKILGKQFSSNCLYDECGGKVTLSVNGNENTEYENYVMQDKDNIEIRYE
jgi:hypothetical protein